MILLVIDTQKLITTKSLFAFDIFEKHLQKLIHTARAYGIEVIYVRHDDGPDQTLTKGKEGFEVYEGFQPKEGEKIFDKSFNSAFNQTGLLEYLQSKGEKDIIAAGLQTDYCMDATIKCGFEHGFHMIVPAYANTTIDNRFMTAEQSYHYYNDLMWNKRYAECLPLDETLKRMEKSKVL